MARSTKSLSHAAVAVVNLFEEFRRPRAGPHCCSLTPATDLRYTVVGNHRGSLNINDRLREVPEALPGIAIRSVPSGAISVDAVPCREPPET